MVPYGVSKGAVRQLTKSVAAYCGNQKYGIRCNSVHPSWIETAMNAQTRFERNGESAGGNM